MGMPLELNTMVVTKNQEKRIDGNTFELTKDEYRIYPLHIPLEIGKTREELFGKVIIKKMIWENQQTTIVYDLVELYGVD